MGEAVSLRNQHYEQKAIVDSTGTGGGRAATGETEAWASASCPGSWREGL